MHCEYCDNTEHITVFVDMSGNEEDIHICRDCYECGAEPRLRETQA